MVAIATLEQLLWAFSMVATMVSVSIETSLKYSLLTIPGMRSKISEDIIGNNEEGGGGKIKRDRSSRIGIM